MDEPRILIVEDDPQFSLIVKNFLESEGMESDIARTRSEAFDKLLYTPFDVILLDLMVGQESGLGILKELKESGSSLPVIMMTAHGSIATVSEAMQMNAFDYVTKPFKKQEILEILRRAIRMSRQKDAEIRRETTGKVVPIIGQSSAMIEVYKAIARVSQTDSTVLITGESGTGKELAARAIHDSSVRSKNPFVAVNCGALTETLLESELFGHAKGAFTGANAAHRGIFESATGGSVFLDEISETSGAFQVKLLRVLQERTIRPVGSPEERPIDVRILAATNRSIDNLIHSSFRKDLLYRLGVIHIRIPALRERTDDIPLLAKHFLHRFNKRQNKSVVIPPVTMDYLMTLPWQGNVRELENAIERAVTMNATGEILPEDLKQLGSLEAAAVIPRESPKPPAHPSEVLAVTPEDTSVPLSLDDVTREQILRVLKHTGGNKLRAAEILGIGRWSLYRMAERLGVKLDELDYEAPPQRKRRVQKAQTANNKADDDLFELLPDVVYTRDLEGQLIGVNTAGEKFFGQQRKMLDVQGEHGLDAMNEALLLRGKDRSLVTVQDATGQSRTMECQEVVLHDASGEPIGVRGILRDVTEAKNLESQLALRTGELHQADEKLQEIDRMKADLNLTLVHELKTPTATMIMALEFLADKLKATNQGDSKEMIAACLASSKNMMQAINDLMERLAKLDDEEEK
ncbi:MAG TPA: sigma 54-interacting transcriptional regulator, partial [Acidobacteriota bacterium]|nr:sigma 54-interacting transcriptional regulator [Acidobacteriota bacterium]